jgi:hypothetical protein
MKISILITEGAKQVMMTPQNDHEKEALKMIAPDDVLKAVAKRGQFDDSYRHANFQVSKCQGGYFRRFTEKDSLMFVIEPPQSKEQ